MQELNFESFLASHEDKDLYGTIAEQQLQLPAWV
jgi:hypothetical protein